MVDLKFELSSVLATTLRNHANNQQNRLDEIVELALRRLFDRDHALIETHAGTASA